MLSRIFILFLCFFWSQQVFSLAQITKVRAWKSPDKTRVVFEITDNTNYSVFQLHNPERLVIDLIDTSIKSTALKNLDYNGLIVNSRSSNRGKNTLRLVLQLKKEVQVKDFQLKPNLGYHHRLVVDLFESPLKQKKSPLTKAKEPKDITKSAPVETSKLKTIKTIKKSAVNLAHRNIVVAIDAGHGGEDPGAIGRRGTKEKKIVLAIAENLSKRVNQQAGMEAVMIRDGDYYVSLRGRTQKARQAKADIFISIHADAFRDSKARGSSVFILSERGASSETARWLADKENSADLAGGVSLDDKDDLLAKVLLDLSQTASIEGSDSVAKRVLNGLKKIGRPHKNSVERAGFAVLKSPDIPSVLIETGFISNPYEESQLRKRSYQKKVADAIFVGINDYFKRYPIPGTIYGQSLSTQSLAKKSEQAKDRNNDKIRHTIVRGDSLTLIAKRYGVSIREIKRLNKIRNNTLILGKNLLISR